MSRTPKQEEGLATGYTDWLSKLYTDYCCSEDGFQLGADTTSSSCTLQQEAISSSCSCKNCAMPDSGDFGDFTLADLDIAPTLDELLRDPLLDDLLCASNSTGSSYGEQQEKAASRSPPPTDSLQQPSPGSSTDIFVVVAATPTSKGSKRDTADVVSGATDSHVSRNSPQPECAAAPQEPDLSPSDHEAHSGQSVANSMLGNQTTAQITAASSGETGKTLDAHAEEEQKKHARLMRNRESAQLSRQRKKMQLEEKERQCQDLQAQNAHLNALVSHLGSENTALRNHLAAVCKQTGQPLPQPLLAPGPLLPFFANPQFPGQMPMQHPAASMHPCMLMHSGAIRPVAKIPIQRLNPVRPAPAMPAAAVGNHGAAQKDTPTLQTKKRRRQAVAGGTTALAALFCFLVFCGPRLPILSPSNNSSSSLFTPSSVHYRALPASDYQEEGHKGRVLQAAYTQESRADMHIDTLDDIAWRGNQTYEDLMLHPHDQETERRTLQHLKDIAPVAVFSPFDTVAQRYSSPAPWKNFGALADSVLIPDGLKSPAVCKKVFSFDASAVEDQKVARQQLQRYMSTLNTFKGRSLKALPLPPIGEKVPAVDEELNFGEEERQKIGCSEISDADYIISVMLPSKDKTDSSYTSLDKLYVVALDPNKKYTTYACELQRPILV